MDALRIEHDSKVRNRKSESETGKSKCETKRCEVLRVTCDRRPVTGGPGGVCGSAGRNVWNIGRDCNVSCVSRCRVSCAKGLDLLDCKGVEIFRGDNEFATSVKGKVCDRTNGAEKAQHGAWTLQPCLHRPAQRVTSWLAALLRSCSSLVQPVSGRRERAAEE